MWIDDILQNKKSDDGRRTTDVGGHEVQPILALSPMADMTDSPFCQIVREIGGCDVVFREMVSSEAIVRDNEKTLGMTDFVEAERPIVQQIFGADPETMARAAYAVMEHANPEGIDINMGCPVYKITSNFNGAALMKEPDRAAAIVKAMKKEIGNTSLSVKIRLGWNDEDTFKTFIPIIEEAGADLITIHGRTKKQGYSGKSDWERIRQAKEIATVPLLANGDIHEWHQVDEALKQTKADGVLIARGALGNPWFFSQYVSQGSVVSLEERIEIIKKHATLHMKHHARMRTLSKNKKAIGMTQEELEQSSLVSFRKHLSWYLKSNTLGMELPGIKELRGALVRINTFDELSVLLGELKAMVKK